MAIMDPHLTWVLARSANVVAGVQNLGRNHSAAQLGWKPSPVDWCMIECIAHLEAAAVPYHPRIRVAIDRTRERNLHSTGPFRSNFLVRAFIRSLEPTAQRKMKAPALFQPQQVGVLDVGVIERYLRSLRELVELIHAADGWDISRVRLASPITPLIRLNIGEALWLLVAHAERHLQQANSLATRPGFPAV
jgi:hypothetical protein